jgi:hypothetical protein
MFDGLMAYGNHYQNLGLLTEIEDYVESKMEGLNMKWDYKQHDTVHTVPGEFDENKKLVGESDVKYADDDKVARDIICNEIKEKLVFYKGQWFLKYNNIWINEFDFIDNYLLTYIQDSNIYRKVESKHGFDTKPFAQNIKCAKNIREGVYSKLKTQSNTQDNIENIYMKFHRTTKGRICFRDGMLDFKTKHFHRWEDNDFPEEYYTTVMINRDFAEYFENPDREVIDKIKKDIFENLFVRDTTKALNFISRGIAGHCEDKNFATYLGNRNSGKGLLFDALKNAFGDYVGSFEILNIMIQRNTDTQEASRKLYWLLDLQFQRLVINQEIPDPKTGLKVASKVFKKMAGGGDELTARRNYDKADTKFYIDSTFLIMGNNEVVFDEEDTKEHQIKFSSVIQFKSQEDIDQMRANGDPELLISAYKVKDTTIKDSCHTEKWANAIVYLLYENYVDSAINIEYTTNTDENDKGSIRRQIFEQCDITADSNHEVLCADVYSRLKCNKTKITNELASMGVSKMKLTKGKNRDKVCFVGLTLKPLPAEEEEEEVLNEI